MADLLREETARGVPVLFSSHQLDLVERLCDDLVVLAAGRVVAQGTVEELRARGPERLRLVTDRDAGWVRDVAGLHVVDVDGPVALLELADHATADAVRRTLLTEGLDRGEVRELAASPLRWPRSTGRSPHEHDRHALRPSRPGPESPARPRASAPGCSWRAAR